MRRLANFASEAEARTLQAVLSTQGIPCCLTNAEIVSNLWHYGNAVGGVTVEVAEENWEAAQAVIGGSAGAGVEWVCAACEAENDAGFDVCWQCGAEHTQLIATPTTIDPPAAIEPQPVSDFAIPEESPVNPNREKLQRAWKASIVGLFVPLGVLNVYSLGLLLTVDLAQIPATERWKYLATWMLDIALLFIIIVIILPFWVFLLT